MLFCLPFDLFGLSDGVGEVGSGQYVLSLLLSNSGGDGSSSLNVSVYFGFLALSLLLRLVEQLLSVFIDGDGGIGCGDDVCGGGDN